MTTIGILSEGRTDQVVIERVLQGFFGRDDRLEVNPIFPPEVPPVGEPEEGGWTVLKHHLMQGRHRQALSLNDYLVIHIDTDVCEDVGFEVPRRDPASESARSPEELREAVIDRLREWMGRDFCQTYGTRLLFAIAVDGIECWLLPLLEDKPAKRSKTTGCRDAADAALSRAGRPSLGATDRVRRYMEEASPYLKRKTLMKKGQFNPSLGSFLRELEERRIVLR